MNKVLLIGNLTKDPEIAETPNGIKVARFDLAVSRTYANSEGNKETDFFHIVAWRGLAENCQQYLKKGNKACISGTIQNRSYNGNDGVKKAITEIIADDVEFLTPKEKVEKEPEQITMTRVRPKLEPIEDNKLPF